jgi:hypothetical protein
MLKNLLSRNFFHLTIILQTEQCFECDNRRNHSQTINDDIFWLTILPVIYSMANSSVTLTYSLKQAKEESQTYFTGWWPRLPSKKGPRVIIVQTKRVNCPQGVCLHQLHERTFKKHKLFSVIKFEKCWYIYFLFQIRVTLPVHSSKLRNRRDSPLQFLFFKRYSGFTWDFRSFYFIFFFFNNFEKKFSK